MHFQLFIEHLLWDSHSSSVLHCLSHAGCHTVDTSVKACHLARSSWPGQCNAERWGAGGDGEGGPGEGIQGWKGESGFAGKPVGKVAEETVTPRARGSSCFCTHCSLWGPTGEEMQVSQPSWGASCTGAQEWA